MSTWFLCDALYASTSAWARTWVAARLHIVMWVPSSTPALNGVAAVEAAGVPGFAETGADVGGAADGVDGAADGVDEVELHPMTATMATAARADRLNGFLIPCSS
jgi:hypothetical protein